MDAISRRPPASPRQIDESNIAIFEKEALERANRLVAKLESAMARWDNEVKNPEGYEQEFAQYRMLLWRLADWEKRMLQPAGMKTRLSRLREFVDIFYSFRG